jgi:hypothetical protein
VPASTAAPAPSTVSPDPVRALRRAWVMPKLAPGAPCPLMTTRHTPDPHLAPIQGDGPVGPAGIGKTGSLEYSLGSDLTDPTWGVAKVLWAVDGALDGPVLVRGRQLDGPNEVRFEDPAVPELVLPDYGPGNPWRDYPSYTRLRAQGCYAYQIDTRSRTSTIVFRAVGPGKFPPASCPVTIGSSRTVPPPPIYPGDRPVPWAGNWYGNTALWVRLPPQGVLPAQSNGTDPFTTKFPWWRQVRGQLSITAQRLDGPSAGFLSDIPDGYGDLGFQPTGLIWPSPGCWRVTGSIAGRSLSFVAWVTTTN